jgi:hypothetical protein
MSFPGFDVGPVGIGSQAISPGQGAPSIPLAPV